MFSITIRERSGQTYTFHFDKAEVQIGRVKGNGNDVILPKVNISKRHALVRVRGDRFVIEDLGSTNGTYVNGRRIAQPIEISADDKVYLGDFVMTFNDMGDQVDMASLPPMPEVPATDAVPAPAPLGPPAAEAAPVILPDLPELPELPPFDDLAELSSAPRETALRAGDAVAPSAAGVSDAEPEPLFDDDADLKALGAPLDVPLSFDDFGLTREPTLPPDPDHAPAVLPVQDATMRRPPVDLAKQTAQYDIQRFPVPLPAEPIAAPAEPMAAPEPVAAPAEPIALPADPLDLLPAAEAMPAELPPLAAADLPELTELPELGDLPELPEAAQTPPATPAQTSAERPLSALTPAPRLPEVPPMRADAYFEALALLYRNAQLRLRPAITTDAAQMTDAEWQELEDRVTAFVDAEVKSGEVQGDLDLSGLKRDLIYELAGLGPLEPMLDDPGVESVEVNGPAQIFVFRGGRREAVPERFSGQLALSAAVDRLVRATGAVVLKGAQHADGTLVDGTTVRVVWPPLCPQGPAVLLRKPRTEAPSLEQLVDRGAVTEKAATVLRYLMAARRSVAICGSPNVGRRTVVNALAQLIPSPERIVVVEDGQRLKLTQEHVVRLDSAAHGEGTPSVLQVARRLMPDWLLLGECLSVSTAELFTVAADGLPPWVASFHARTIDDFVERASHAIVIRHAGIPDAVARARVTRAVDAVACFEFDHEAGREVLRSVAVLNTTGFGPPFKWLSPEDFEGARA